MADINLECVECKNSFYFSERDQLFFKEKGFQQPKRCYNCRQKRKTNGSQAAPASSNGRFMGFDAPGTLNAPPAARPGRRYNDESDDD